MARQRYDLNPMMITYLFSCVARHEFQWAVWGVVCRAPIPWHFPCWPLAGCLACVVLNISANKLLLLTKSFCTRSHCAALIAAKREKNMAGATGERAIQVECMCHNENHNKIKSTRTEFMSFRVMHRKAVYGCGAMRNCMFIQHHQSSIVISRLYRNNDSITGGQVRLICASTTQGDRERRR